MIRSAFYFLRFSIRKHAFSTFFLLMLTAFLSGASYYFADDFSTNLSTNAGGRGWLTNLAYGQQGAMIGAAVSEQAGNTVLPGKLFIRNAPHNTATRDGYWCNRWAIQTNRYNPTPDRPFGWEIIREVAKLDYSDVNNTTDGKAHAMTGIGFIQIDGSGVTPSYGTAATYEWQNTANYFEFIDHVGRWDTYRQQISYFDGFERTLTNECEAARTADRIAVTNINPLLLVPYRPGAGGAVQNYSNGFDSPTLPADWSFVNCTLVASNEITNETGYRYGGTANSGSNMILIAPGGYMVSPVVTNPSYVSYFARTAVTNSNSSSAVYFAYQDAPTTWIAIIASGNHNTNSVPASLTNLPGLAQRTGNAIDALVWTNVYFMISNTHATVPCYIDTFYVRATCNSNTNKVGYRMVHDGSGISLHMNPNPYGENSYPNEWLFLKRVPVAWSNALQLMVGHGMLADWDSTAGLRRANSVWDNLLVRSAADVSSNFIQPPDIRMGQPLRRFSIFISNEILPSPTNAGINMIRIVKPSSFDWDLHDPLDTNLITVVTRYDGTEHVLTNGIYVPGFFPADNAAHVFTNWWSNNTTNELWILLGNQVTNRGNADDERIEVRLWLKATNDSFKDDGFAVYVNGEQFNAMPAGKQGMYSTCGWQKTVGSGRFTPIILAPDGFASITPSRVAQGSVATPYTFTYYIKLAAGSYYADALSAAILIPDAFSNCIISNYQSTIIGAGASSYFWRTNIPGVTNANGESNLVYIDYAGAGAYLSQNGLDVIEFKLYVTNTNAPALTNDAAWSCWIASNAVNSNTNETRPLATNGNFVNQMVSVVPSTLSPWDYQVVAASNAGIVALTVSTAAPLAYVDIIKDGETTNEALTGCSILLGGTVPDVYGQVLLYRDSDLDRTKLSTGGDTLVASNWITTPSGAISLAFTDTNQTTDDRNPTRYWIALLITNTADAVYSNTVSAYMTNLTAVGVTNVSNVDGLSLVTNAGGVPARVDRNTLPVSNIGLLTNTIRQGTFNNAQFAIVISNNDPDAVYYLGQLLITNAGTASNVNDIGSIKLFRDNGDGIFCITNSNAASNDTVVMAGLPVNEKVFNLSATPPLVISGGSNARFYVAFDVEFGATMGRTIDLRISHATNISFSDEFNDGITLVPSVTGIFPSPGVGFANAVITYNSKPYDFYLQDVSYGSVPSAVTTNQAFAAGSLELVMDTESTNTQVLRGVDVHLASTVSRTNITGIAWLYRETNGDGVWSAADMPVGSNGVVSGNDFAVNCAVSNVSVNSLAPDTFYLVFMLTNNIAAAKSNTVSFSITNIRTEGPNSGVTTNTNLLTNVSRETRMDSGRVIVSYVSNISLPPPDPKQASVNNFYLVLMASNEDGDATNWLSAIDISSNTRCTVDFANGHIPTVKVFDTATNLIGYRNFAAGEGRIDFITPVAIAGAAPVTLFVGYDVSSSPGVTNKLFGLRITNGGYAFDDSMNGFHSYVTGGGGPFVETNIRIKPLAFNTWDFQVMGAGNTAPASIGVSNEYVLSWFDLICDNTEFASIQTVTNCRTVLAGSCADIAGMLRIYADTNGFRTNFSGGEELLAGVPFAAGSITNDIAFSRNNLSQDYNNPTRFWLTLAVTNTNAAGIYNNTVALKPVAVMGSGPDSGAVDYAEGLTNGFGAQTSRVDSFRTAFIMSATNTNLVRQSTFVNFYGELRFISEDTDAVNFLGGLTVSNIGNAQQADLGAMRIFKDNGDGVFSNSVDELVMSGSVSANGVYALSAISPVPLTGPTNVFWMTYDVAYGAQVGRTIAFRINASSDIVFTNGYSDGYARGCTVTNAGPYPNASASNIIDSLQSLPFDFDILNASYLTAPSSFTTNQYVPVGTVQLYRDTPASGTQHITNAYVRVYPQSAKSNVSGWVCMFRETNGDGVFSVSDKPLGSNYLAAGIDGINVPMDSNDVITGNRYDPDRLYLVFLMTNDIEPAKGDRIGFAVTNFEYYVNGGTPDGIGFTNHEWIETNESRVMRVDSQRVIVDVIANDILNYFPNQNSADNPYLHLRMHGDDPDATNLLMYIDVGTNGYSTVSGSMVPYVLIYTNKLSAFKLSGSVSPAIDFTGTDTRIPFTVPFTFYSTNAYDLYIGYFINSTAVPDTTLGFTITNGSFGFSDAVPGDSIVQRTIVTGMTSGPLTETNVTIRKLGAQFWDEQILFAENKSPERAVVNAEIPIISFNVYRESEITNRPEYLSGFIISNCRTNEPFVGFFNVYTNTKWNASYTNGVRISASNYISNLNTAVTIGFSNTGSADYANYDRYFITYTPVSFNSAATNLFTVSGVLAGGPNGGIVDGAEMLTNLPMTPIALENPAVSVAVTPLLPAEAKQGSNRIAAMKIAFTALDDDAAYLLSSLTFTIEETGSNSIGNAALYGDNGTNAGVFDDADGQVEGATGFFVNGKMKLTLTSNASITSNARIFYLVVKIGEDAKANGTFRICMPRTEQTGFAALSILGQEYPVALAPYNPDVTGYCTVLLNVTTAPNERFAAANTFINIANGEYASIYLATGQDASRYKAYVYDALGNKITELAFTGSRIDWGGERSGGGRVRAGVYAIIITGPENYRKYFKILVVK